MRRKIALACLLFFVSSAIARAAEETSFRVRLGEDLHTLDWNYGEVNPEIQYQLMEGLFRNDANGKPVPAVAKKFSWNKARTVLRLELDPKRRWSDGAPVCAKDFAASWSRLQSKELLSPYAHYANSLKSVVPAGCHRLTVTFRRPSPEAPALLSHYVFFPLRPELLAADPAVFRRGTGLLVNGPYRVRSWERGQKLTLEPNPHYGGPAPKIKIIEFYFVPEDGTAQVLFEQGKLDWLRDLSNLLRTPVLEQSPAYRQFPSLTAFYFGVNAAGSKLAADPDVRRALSEALAREELPRVLGSEHHGMRTWLPASLEPGLKEPAADPEALARGRAKLLAAEKAGKLDLSLRIYAKASHRTLAEWAQEQWRRRLGVKIPIEVREAKAYWRSLADEPAPIFLSGITAPYPHARAYLQEFLSDSTANWTSWRSRSFDEAVNAGRYRKAESILEEAGFVIPLYRRDAVALVRPRWKGFRINPLGQVSLSELE